MHRLDKHTRQMLGAEVCGCHGPEGTVGRSDTMASVKGSKGAFIQNSHYSRSYEEYLIWRVNLPKKQNTIFSL